MVTAISDVAVAILVAGANAIGAAIGGDTRPLSYQRRGGRRAAVESRYSVKRGDGYGFALGGYDRSRPLVIDSGLAYSTFLGGGADEQGRDIAVDSVIYWRFPPRARGRPG